MSDPTPPRPIATTTLLKAESARNVEKTLCERCGAEMYRMHAVWRCPTCGFKTDCCGW
jgi:rubrerythrin